MIKKELLFLIPFLITVIAVVGYFKLTQKISKINIPSLPAISFSDIVKFSRFSLEKAPSQSLVGTISSMSGEVEYQPRLATESAKISIPPAQIQQGESLSTGSDGEFVLTFEKAAELVVSPDSYVGIMQTLPANIVFSQNKGTVEYKKLANIPVSIRSFHLLIENNGDLILTVDKIKPKITISVESGSAIIAFNDKQNISRVMTIEAGKILIFNEDTRKVVVE